MAYFKRLYDERTYSGSADDFHFIYNANTGGGQSFLGGKFYDNSGQLVSPSVLNGKTAFFKFVVHTPNGDKAILLNDPVSQYEIKPRASGDNNMKFGVGTKPTPSSVVSAFLMLPEPCGVKCPIDLNAPIMSIHNFWINSMWLAVGGIDCNMVELTPRDCVICGGVDKKNGTAQFYFVDIERRIKSIIDFSYTRELDDSIKAHLKYFADTYLGVTKFDFSRASNEVKCLMHDLSANAPDFYSGTTDPLLAIIKVMMKNHQRITYGAPGTGKSNGVDAIASKLPKENVIRTTFHPDSDYSTFVGAYKPTMVRELAEQENKHLGIDQLADILKREYDAAGEGADKKTLAVDLFAEQYYEYLDGRFGKVSLEDLLTKAETPQRYNVCLRDSINVAKYHAGEKVGKKHISYEFVPQAFAKAYVQAWKRMANPEVDGKAAPVLLIIEEINRGNCAQIFGDLFQLLDRHAKGVSEYPVLADSDLADYIRGALTDAEKTRIKENGYGNVVADEDLELMLPPNMYIWATMNTSDQSLFPIDSAFKRRWDWKYVPIVEPDKSDDPDWRRRAIKVKDQYYDWWTFLTIINHFIETTTKSEDKQLGYFFVKAPDATGVITADQFVNKVLFYLFGDVFKDWKLPEAVFGKGDGKFYSFKDFFGKKVDEINEDAVVKFLEKMEWKDDQNKTWKMEPSNTAPQPNAEQATSKDTEAGEGPAVDGTAGAGAQNDAEPVAE